MSYDIIKLNVDAAWNGNKASLAVHAGKYDGEALTHLYDNYDFMSTLAAKLLAFESD